MAAHLTGDPPAIRITPPKKVVHREVKPFAYKEAYKARAADILAFIARNPDATTERIAALFFADSKQDDKFSAARLYLSRQVKNGMLTRTGERKNFRWHVAGSASK